MTINGQSLLTILEDDALLAAGSPLLTFLGAIQTAGGDPIKELGAWIQFQGNLAPALGTFELSLISQITVALTVRLQAALAKVQAAHP